MKKLFVLFLFFSFPVFIFSQGNDNDKVYYFSSEEISSGFVYEQLYNLTDTHKYCIYQRVMTNAYYKTPLPEEAILISIQYQGSVVAFNFTGHKTILLFLFSNSSTAHLDGLFFHERLVNKGVITTELEKWFQENS